MAQLQLRKIYHLIVICFSILILPDCYAYEINEDKQPIEWQLVAVDDSLVAESSYEREKQLIKISVKTTGSQLFINNILLRTKTTLLTEDHTNYAQLELITKLERQKYLGEIALTDVVIYHIDFPNNDYLISQPIIWLLKDNYLVIYTDDKYILYFRPIDEVRKSFFYEISKASQIILPIDSKLLNTDEPNFIPLSLYYDFYLGTLLLGDNYLSVAKIVNKNEHYHLFLLSSEWSARWWHSTMLISLSEKGFIIDKIMIIDEFESENEGIDCHSIINEKLMITKTCEKIENGLFDVADGDNRLGKTCYQIDDTGHFIETKNNEYSE